MANPTRAIIGAGGIGSHFCRLLNRMLTHHQFGNLTHNDFVVFDFDVVEFRNTKWQDYTQEEVGNPKAVLMAERYGFNAEVKRFGQVDVANFDVYLIAADNPAVRQIIFEHAIPTKKKFVDMRAEGDIYAVFTQLAPLDTLLGSLGEDKDSTKGVSCQRFADQERNVIQLGNWFSAIMGMDVFLRQAREIPYPAQLVRAII